MNLDYLDSPIKIGVIGAGRQGNIHARNISTFIANAKLTAMADLNKENVQKIVAGLPLKDVQIYGSYEDMLNNADIDAIVIASSTNTHEHIIKKAVEAGKHIFCEKPLALDLSVIDNIIDVVQKSNIKLMVGFNRRFDPSFLKVKHSIQNGEIGQAHALHIISRDPAPPHLEYLKVSGGIFYDCTIHDFDMARHLIGAEVEEVYATGSVLVDEEIGKLGDIDTTMITLKFKNGVVGSIHNSRQAVYGYDQRVEVFGSKGSLQALNETPTRVALFNESGTHTDKPLYFNNERYPQSFINEMNAFVEAIIHNKPSPVTVLDGKAPILIAKAALESYKLNRPVCLSEVN